MVRKIIEIDEEKCNGCGECVTACAEGAIAIIDAKAKLISDVYCDGLGACLGECPEGALTMTEREAVPFDEAAVEEHLKKSEARPQTPHACPGSAARQLSRPVPAPETDAAGPGGPVASQLGNWPVQLALLNPGTPYLQGADLLFVADCVPFALPDFHSKFLSGKALAIGCPKLDDPSLYVDKLAQILGAAAVNSLTVVHMEVPCCSGLTRIASAALASAGREVPASDVTVSIQGEVLEEQEIVPQALGGAGASSPAPRACPSVNISRS